MEVKTAIANDIELTEARAKLDASCKRILANKIILAWLLKECVEEFNGYGVKDISEKYIEGEPQISSEAVHQDEAVPEKIKGVNTEDKTLNEGTVTYDIKFTAIIPATKDRVHMYINVEAQNEFHPGYPLVKRMIYYCCRMISSQYSREFTQSEYDKLKKVCSIWICTNPPEKRKNTITEYLIQERTVFGNSTVAKEAYDLIRGIMICLGDGGSADKILQLLNVLMTQDINYEKKKQILESDFDIEMTRELNVEVEKMCNYSDGIFSKGEQKGKEEGREEGRKIGKEEGRKIGEKNAKRQNAIEMLKDKLPVNAVVKYSGLTYEEVIELKEAC